LCGIIGIIGSKDAVDELYTGAIAIQHRGQDSGGLVTFNSSDKKPHRVRRSNWISTQFNHNDLDDLRGDGSVNAGIGHVRYSTVGGGVLSDAQPFYKLDMFFVSMAFNGNITNFQKLKEERLITSSCDLEGILNVFVQEVVLQKDLHYAIRNLEPDILFNAVSGVMDKIEGSYSTVAHLPGSGMLAFRDPHGFKPLCFGIKETADGPAYAFSSETVSLQTLGYSFLDNIKPGEAVFIGEDGKVQRKQIKEPTPHLCFFELEYFSKNCSVIDGISVSRYRYNRGKRIAEEWLKRGLEADIVSEVPTSSIRGSHGFVHETGIPYRSVFDRNNYIGRSFIAPDMATRRMMVRLKLPIDESVLEGNIILFDDSIVRGTTSRIIIDNLKRLDNVQNVHFVSQAPPIRYPCVYGIDMAVDTELVASGRTEEEVRQQIGADSLTYQLAETLGKDCNDCSLCTACVTGDYPTGISEEDIQKIKDERLGHKR
jgi:amidophosphoribosyltransferase